MPEGGGSAVPHVGVAPQPHVLVGRRRVPVDPRNRQIARCRGEHLDGESVGRAPARDARDVELVSAKGAGHAVARRDADAVHPDVRAVVDPVEIQPDRPVARRSRQIEFPPVPPRHAVRAVGRHRQQRELLADRVRRSGNGAEVHRRVRVWIPSALDQRADDRSRYARSVPPLGLETGARNRLAVQLYARRGLNGPTGVQRDAKRLGDGCRGREADGKCRQPDAEQDLTHEGHLRGTRACAAALC